MSEAADWEEKPVEEPDPPVAFMVFYDHPRQITVRWDGLAPDIEMFSGGLARPKSELIPLTGIPYDIHSAVGWLRWFESIAMHHIRMREASDEEVVQ